MPYSSSLPERTFEFAKAVASFCKHLPRDLANREYSLQVIRSSASIGANYLEANDPLSQKDFLFRIRICRKEAKETAYFLSLLASVNAGHIASEAERLVREAIELKKIFSAILLKMTLQ